MHATTAWPQVDLEFPDCGHVWAPNRNEKQTGRQLGADHILRILLLLASRLGLNFSRSQISVFAESSDNLRDH